MSQRIDIAKLPDFDAATLLETGEEIAAFLTDILETGDAGLLASALGDVARARGMTEVAKSAGISREALYKALRADSAPRFDTISRVLAALGVRLVAEPVVVTGAAASAQGRKPKAVPTQKPGITRASKSARVA